MLRGARAMCLSHCWGPKVQLGFGWVRDNFFFSMVFRVLGLLEF